MTKCKHKFVFYKSIDNHYHKDFKGDEGQTNLYFFCEKCLEIKIKVIGKCTFTSESGD